MGGSSDLLDGSHHRFFPEIVTIIPLPALEMTRYLLVEVSHFISPSHFYLIVNDEKCGANAFEDFLEAFQNFYKSLEYLLEEEEALRGSGSYQNGFVDDPEETEVDLEWKLYFTSPPSLELVTNGSYWAGYIDDEYDWRRIQVIQFVDDSEVPSLSKDNPEMLFAICDVDSGYSCTVPITALRPLREEFGSIPAFAIRASLAYLYPRTIKTESIGTLEPPSEESNQSEWPTECCSLFEALTYDQILTASIIEIQREELTDTEVAQVLLWCSPSSGTGGGGGGSSSQEDEIFINRKLIELNYAANVADDDRWLARSNETVNCSARSSQAALLKHHEATEAQSQQQQTSSLADVNELPMTPENATVVEQAETPLSTTTTTVKKKKLKKTISKKKKEPGCSITEAVNNLETRSIQVVPEVVVPSIPQGEPNTLLGESQSSTTDHSGNYSNYSDKPHYNLCNHNHPRMHHRM